jgi:protein arginine kinase activator
MPVMCKSCGVRPAQIHYTEIVNNNMVTMDLCIECAEDKGIDVQKAGSHALGDLFAGMIDTSVDAASERLGKVQCPNCGYNYSDFRKVGRFGCPECYRAFEPQLLPLLRQLHGSTQHQGRAPAEMGPTAHARQELMDLKDELARAVEKEEYERAAQIRDRIKELETQVEEKK